MSDTWLETQLVPQLITTDETPAEGQESFKIVMRKKPQNNDKCIMKLMQIPLKIGLIGYFIQTFYSLHLHIQYILYKVIKEMSHKDPLLICGAVVKHQSFISI